MAKLSLNSTVDISSATTASATINANSAAIVTAFDNTLSRDGTTPNQMLSNLDMNGYRVLNVPAPTSATDLVRFGDLQSVVTPTGLTIPSPTGNAGKFLETDGTIAYWASAASSGFLSAANNLSDVSAVATARSNLGLGSSALFSSGTSGATVPLLNGINTWSGGQTMSAGLTLTGSTEARISYTPSTISTDSVGFRGAPVNGQDATYTLVLNDAGKNILHTSSSAHTWTVPPNSSVAFPIGTTILVQNIGSGLVTITRGSGVSIIISGSGSSADRSLAQWGFATLYQYAANSWIVGGSGIS